MSSAKHNCPLGICHIKRYNEGWGGYRSMYEQITWEKPEGKCQQPDNCGDNGCNIVKRSQEYSPMYDEASSNRVKGSHTA